MESPSVLLLCLTAAAMSSAYALSSPHMWNKVILAHHWPTTFCSMEHCHQNFSRWTLHGLWPNNGMNCNNSWPLDLVQIEDLLPDMEKNWPDLFNTTSPNFWKYEWHKHGTCAARAPSLSSQHLYFSKSLELFHQLDLDGVLRKFSIIPSDKPYSFSDIETVIQNFYAVRVKIQCGHSHQQTAGQLLGQIEICFNSSFSLTDCEKSDAMATVPTDNRRPSELRLCDHNMPVYYPPSP